MDDVQVRERLRRAGTGIEPPEPAFQRLLERRDVRRRHERVVAGVVAIAIAAAVFGGIATVLRFASHGDGAPTGGSVAPILEPGQYLYLRILDQEGGDGSQTVQQTWWAIDGSGEVRFETDRQDKYESWPPEGTYGAGAFPIESDVSGLSPDPIVLKDQLIERSAPGGASPQPDVTPGGGLPLETGQLWRAIRRLLEYPNSPPQLRAALFDVASGLTGVTRQDGITDPVGRDAVALALTSEGVDRVLYFDPLTHQLMATTAAWDGAVGSIQVLTSGIVDQRGASPRVDGVLFPLPAHDPAPPIQPSPSLP